VAPRPALGLWQTLLAVVVVVLAITIPAHAADASVLWTADAEKPASQEWASSAAPGVACTVTGPNMSTKDLNVTPAPQPQLGPAASHPNAYHFQISDGEDCYGQRSELGQANPESPQLGDRKFYPGQEVWVGFEAYLPSNYQLEAPNGYSTGIMQFKQIGGHGYPAMQMRNGGGHLCFYVDSLYGSPESKNCDTGAFELGATAKNAWIKLMFHVYFSGNQAGESPGFVEILGDLQNGEGFHLLLPRVSARTSKLNEEVAGNPPLPTQARIGMYRNPLLKGTEDLYIAGFTAATDRASAEANAFSPHGAAVIPPLPGESPAPTPAPKVKKKAGSGTQSARVARQGKLGVWLRLRKVGLSARARKGRPVSRVFGGVVGDSRPAGRLVVIQALRGGRWRRATVTRSGSDGHFSLAVAVPAGSTRLRASVAGIGRSRALAVHR
jgi:Polysaccharide lyase